MTTKFSKTENYKQQIYLLDASNKILGKFATEVSQLLIGKNTNFISPGILTKNIVIISNAHLIKVSGKKESFLKYYNPTTRPGNLKSILFKDLIEKAPYKILEAAIKGMLPKNKLRKHYLSNLYIYAFDVKSTSLLSAISYIEK